MKWTLLAVLFGIAVCNASGQKYFGENITTSPVNIPVDEANKTFVAPPDKFIQLKSAQANQTNIEVSYVNFPEDAKQAFEYAVSIWESLISSRVTIHVKAEWKPISGGVLALSRPAMFYEGFDGALVDNVYYPVTLVEKLSGEDVNPGQPDIICSFSSDFQWYFGTDGNTPSSKYDFVTSVLHELAHGLGISGFLEDENGRGYFDNDRNLPSIYDYYLFNQFNQQISDKSIFSSPSTDLHKQLTSDNLKLRSVETNNNGADIGRVFAPSYWSAGASVYHMHNATTDNNSSKLMNAYLFKGAAYHQPEDATLKILQEIGWGAPVFEFEELKDIEEPCAAIPVNVKINGVDNQTDFDVEVVFSTDYFASSHTSPLQYKNETGKCEGEMPVDFHTGNVQYYFNLKDSKNRSYTLPTGAPAKKYAMRIGPDYFSPEIKHNPVKIISQNSTGIDFSAIVTDNMGINSVKIEYKINDTAQEPVLLHKEENNYFKGILNIPENIQASNFEYRVIAEDNSSRKNKKTQPSTGYYKVNVFTPEEAVLGYSNDFESNATDFTLADFDISWQPGFSNGILHSSNPYPVSAIETEKNNLIAQLNHPVVVQPGGQMTFDEVVLVEPGEAGQNNQDMQLWDYVIVEASKNNGETWLPLTEGYNSGNEMDWISAFNNNLKSTTSEAAARENMFVKRTINLTGNSGFEAGDTLIFRFRLASDYSVNGWGWAIDNLEIQKMYATGNDDLMADTNVGVYPNPFENSFYVDCTENTERQNVEIRVTDLYGKTIFHETNIDTFFSPKTRIDLSGATSGIYLVSISDETGSVSTNKIVKN
ncbi:MAG: T9SS type A sorting domain-containing protein [Tangfeifania sp.]